MRTRHKLLLFVAGLGLLTYLAEPNFRAIVDKILFDKTEGELIRDERELAASKEVGFAG